MSKQVARRTTDRIVEQFGESIGERQGCVVEAITDKQFDELALLAATPNGGIIANADGTFAAQPVPAAPLADPQIATDKNLVTQFMGATSGTATAAQRDDVIKALVRYLRRMGQDA